MRFSAIAAAVAYLPSVIVAAMEAYWGIVIVDTLAYAVLLVAAYGSWVPYNVKLILLVCSSLLVGMVVLIYTGPLGAGYIWLIVAVVLSALFSIRRLVAATIGLTMAFMAAWSLALYLGAEGHGATPVTVLIIGASLLVACLMLAIVTQRLLVVLANALAERELLAVRLSEELAQSNAVRAELKAIIEIKEDLLRELQHRVRNNLQVVQSLLALDEESDRVAGTHKEDNKRRIGALTIANDLFLSRPEDGRIDGYELLRSIVQQAFDERHEGACSVRATGNSGASLDPQSSVIVALLTSDLVASFADIRPLVLSFEGRDHGLRLEIRSPKGTNQTLLETVYRRLTSGRIARSCAHEVSLGIMASEGAQGGGLYLEI